jgi:hypothetical protein
VVRVGVGLAVGKDSDCAVFYNRSESNLLQLIKNTKKNVIIKTVGN